MGATNRVTRKADFWTVDETDGSLHRIASIDFSPAIAVGRGFALYHSPVSGKYYAFVTNFGNTDQYELDGSSGTLTGKLVRQWSVANPNTEGLVADDERGLVYLAEENVGRIGRYGAEPTDPTTSATVDTTTEVGGHIVQDIKGLAIIYGRGGAGYLLAISQGGNAFHVYDRAGANAYRGEFAIGDCSATTDKVTGMDGIDATNVNLGPAFPDGLFVTQDTQNPGTNQNFKLVPWGAIARPMGLTIDTGFNPRDIGALGSPTPLPTPTPIPDPVPDPTPGPAPGPAPTPTPAGTPATTTPGASRPDAERARRHPGPGAGRRRGALRPSPRRPRARLRAHRAPGHEGGDRPRDGAQRQRVRRARQRRPAHDRRAAPGHGRALHRRARPPGHAAAHEARAGAPAARLAQGRARAHPQGPGGHRPRRLGHVPAASRGRLSRHAGSGRRSASARRRARSATTVRRHAGGTERGDRASAPARGPGALRGPATHGADERPAAARTGRGPPARTRAGARRPGTGPPALARQLAVGQPRAVAGLGLEPAGEEWTESADWKAAFVDEVLLTSVPPGGTVLEIGPGGGRWSDILVPRAAHAILVDVTPKALELCRTRLAGADDVAFVLSRGSDLPGVADASVDVVWSFDVFVHVAPVDQAGYLAEIARVLRPGGSAVIHHADGRNRGRVPSAVGWRTPMSSRLFRRLAEERGLVGEREIRSWGRGRFGLETFGDAISVVRRPA